MKTMVIASLSLLTISIGLGIWIGTTGSPYNAALLAIHKLSSVGFAVLCVIYFVKEVRETGMATADLVLAILFVVALIVELATGAVMSGKEQPALLLRIAHAASAGILSLGAGWKLITFLIS